MAEPGRAGLPHVRSKRTGIRFGSAIRRVPDSKVVDAPPHKLSIGETVAITKGFALVVLFTSSPGLSADMRIGEMMKDLNPELKVAFVGPPVTIESERVLQTSRAIDFVVQREFDYPIVNFANGAPLSSLPGVSYFNNSEIVHNPEDGMIEDLDARRGSARSTRETSISGGTTFRSCSIPHFSLHDQGMPSPLHLLSLAADSFRSSMAAPLGTFRCR